MPGMTIVCGDSHTATHGAFGALAFGIGTSEVEHVLATQTLPQSRPKWMSVNVEGTTRPGVTAKDIVLAIIGQIGTGGGIGHVIEYRGQAIRDLSMEGRMTVCNMSIEAGAKAGMIAPDQTTFDYLEGRDHAPKGDDWDAAVADWSTLQHRRRRRRGTTRSSSSASTSPRRSPGARTPARSARSTAPSPHPTTTPMRPPATTVDSSARVHGARGGHRDQGHRRSTRSSSARARTAGSKTCGRRPRSWRVEPSPCRVSWSSRARIA